MTNFWKLWIAVAGAFLAGGTLLTYLIAGYWDLGPEFLAALVLVSFWQTGAVWLWLRSRTRRSKLSS